MFLLKECYQMIFSSEGTLPANLYFQNKFRVLIAGTAMKGNII